VSASQKEQKMKESASPADTLMKVSASPKDQSRLASFLKQGGVARAFIISPGSACSRPNPGDSLVVIRSNPDFVLEKTVDVKVDELIREADADVVGEDRSAPGSTSVCLGRVLPPVPAAPSMQQPIGPEQAGFWNNRRVRGINRQMESEELKIEGNGHGDQRVCGDMGFRTVELAGGTLQCEPTGCLIPGLHRA
jgi:hypothetical protein